jgi:hypothetical protein
MIVPSPAGMHVAAFNIGRLAVYFALSTAPACSVHTSPHAYGIQILAHTLGLESGVERGTVRVRLTLQIV